MADVRNATAPDFPKLQERWKDAFYGGTEGADATPGHRKDAAMRWFYANWLAKDSEGFLKAIQEPNLDFATPAAQVLVEFMPEKAVAWLSGSEASDLNRYFIFPLAAELAEQRPGIYVKMNPEGRSEFTPGVVDHAWLEAITSLAKTDPMAAANACLDWKGDSAEDLFKALSSVAAAWKSGDFPIVEWLDHIADPTLRNMAWHAHLCELANTDPHAALAELGRAKVLSENRIEEDAHAAILAQLTKADPIAALRLMKQIEAAGDQSADSPDEEATRAASPFSDPRWKEGSRGIVLGALAGSLSDEPGEFFATLKKLVGTSGGDASWQSGLEIELIRLKCGAWPASTCLTVAGQRAGQGYDPAFAFLAVRAAREDPETALASLNLVPESDQPTLSAEIIKQLPAADKEQKIALLRELPALQWDSALGTSLGEHAADYAPLIATLPAATTAEARESFMKAWGREDPEAAARWLAALPPDASIQSSAAGLAAAWVTYDDHAATAWAATLPPGHTRDGAATSFARAFQSTQPEKAWHWAASISEPSARATELGNVAVGWGSHAPDEFRAALTDARLAAGLPEETPEDSAK